MAGESDVPENTLSCANCGKPANLQCPKCMELKLPREGSAFCSQECFKSSWSSHKSVHLKAKLSSTDTQNSGSVDDSWLYCLKRGQARTPKIPYFDWTGSLRPYPISSKRIVPGQIDKPDWADDGIPKIEPNSGLQHTVEVKTPDQIERMRETCRIAREVLDAAARIIQPGVTTDEIDRVVHEATIAAGKLELVFGRLSLASSGNQLCATEKLMAKKSEEECQIMIQKSFRTPMVRFLRERLEKAGCTVEDKFFKAITCNQEVAGSYVRGEGIKVCSNYVRIQDDVNQVVIRELIHAFDDCRAANLDWSNCAQHACTEIRTNHLSGDCHYKRELLRGFLKLRGHEQECVRRKVLKSLSANPNCSGFAAEDSLEAVWDVCYNDTQPFDRAP